MILDPMREVMRNRGILQEKCRQKLFILFRCFLPSRFRFRRFSFCSLLCRSRFRDFREYFLDPADINIHRQARDQLSDHLQRHILKLLEPHATPAHVELLARVLPRFLEPRLQLRIAVTAHQIKSHVVLLRTQIHERQRHLGIALIPLGINAVRHHVSDHAVTHALFVPLGQIRENDASHRVNCLATIRGQFLQIFLNGLGAALHNPISFTGLLAKTTKADTTRAKSTQAQNRLPNRIHRIPLENRVDSIELIQFSGVGCFHGGRYARARRALASSSPATFPASASQRRLRPNSMERLARTQQAVEIWPSSISATGRSPDLRAWTKFRRFRRFAGAANNSVSLCSASSGYFSRSSTALTLSGEPPF